MNRATPNDFAVVPFSLKDAPALIEKAWPTAKISAETQKERKAGSGQTLTGLGSYWKGRKPLILTRACVLASLLPATEDLDRDVAIFEMLMGFSDEAMRRRLPRKKHDLIHAADYPARVATAKRPEEIDDAVLLEGIWDEVNEHLGTHAGSIVELVEQLGIMRFGRRPKFADTFSGSGSIPFEAARMGCDVYASDLNPIACMLTWGAFNIVGASPEEHARMKTEQKRITAEIDRDICEMGIEHDEAGNRAKVYLYCLETRCPRTGWMVPMLPSRVLSGRRYDAIVDLLPDHERKRYDIIVRMGVTKKELADAKVGTIVNGKLFHEVLNDSLGIAVKEIRGDHKDGKGVWRNNLRPWEINDIRPRPDDIWQERLYAIQWMDADDVAADKKHPRTWFAAPTARDLAVEERVATYVQENLTAWQQAGVVPDMAIEPGYNTSQPIRERGWTHWHHLFNPRHLLVNATAAKHARGTAHMYPGLASLFNRSARTTSWNGGMEKPEATFTNQALNTMMNYPARAWSSCSSLLDIPDLGGRTRFHHAASNQAACVVCDQDIIVTDPPYADAVQYDEITEYFIGWLRKNPPSEFNNWVWDSRRAMAIKGEGQSFKAAMIETYKAIADAMSECGIQVVQFTHQDSKTYADMAQIFWGAGLQVLQTWYISTETMNALKVGGYVQGTHMIVLRKRGAAESGYSDEIVHEIRDEVERQIAEMTGLNDQLDDARGENIFNDADLQMAGYAAALRVLTSYTKIDGMDMTREALRPRKKGEPTIVDELTEFAVQTANEFLVPSGLDRDLWLTLNGAERFFLKMMEIEAAGPAKLDQFQNFAKAFRVGDYDDQMASKMPNDARLKSARGLGGSSMVEGALFGRESRVRLALRAIWRTGKGDEIDDVIEELRDLVPNYIHEREALITIIGYIAEKRRTVNEDEARAARVLGAAIRNERI